MSGASVLPMVLLGPPGSGKGTQAKILAEKNPAWVHISTGDLFRGEIKSESALGKQVKDILASGQLVSDDVTYQVFSSQTLKILNDKKPVVVMFDGYPRTAAQAQSFLKFLSVHQEFKTPVTVEFEISEDAIVSRLSDRLVNPRTGQIYHRVSNPPKNEGVCDVDGGQLEQRSDDQPETVRKRYKIYEAERNAIVSELSKQGRQIKINATVNLSEVSKQINQLI